MTHVRLLIAAGAALFCTVAWAGPFDQPYGLIESGWRLETRKEEPVAISRIDGRSPRDPRRSDPVAPGRHVVQISFDTARTLVPEPLQTIEIDVQPCKRYRIAAHYESAVSGQWKPVVQQVEDIGECKRRFMSAEGSK